MPVLLIAIALLIIVTLWLLFNPRLRLYSEYQKLGTDKFIALTFDDGPSPESTDQVLNILSEAAIKATFFVVGKNVRKYPALLKKTASAGHLIANHSNKHSYIMALTPKLILADVEATSSAVKEVIGRRPNYYRPPYGFRTPWGAKAIHDTGYSIVTWNNMTYDYFGLSGKRIIRSIIKRSRAGGIIVLHDGREGLAIPGYANMLEALPQIIKSLKLQGYTFVKIDDLIGQPGYRD